MLYFTKLLPDGNIDTVDWKPFIRHKWFRNNFMSFTYCLQAVFLTLSFVTGIWKSSGIYQVIVLFSERGLI